MRAQHVAFPRVHGTHFQHLDKRNTEIQVRFVSTNQAQAKEEADGEDGSEVDLAGHLDRLAAIEEGRGPRENLGHAGCEDHMPVGANQS